MSGIAGHASRARAGRRDELNASRPWWQTLVSRAWMPLVFVVVVAGFFRLWHIAGTPPGLFGDEATDGLDALDVLAGRGQVFFPANFGREGLHIWLVAFMFRLFGVSALSVRLPSVAAGILTALATYWLGRELLAAANNETRQADSRPWGAGLWPWTPLIAALYLSTSYFHVHYSRFGIRGVFTPLCGALAFAAFWRAANTRRYLWYAVSGVCLGLSLHFYTASRFYPVLLAVFLLAQAVISLAGRRRDQAILLRDIGGVALLFLIAGLVFAPLGLYFVRHPGSFAQRAAEVSAFKGVDAWTRIGHAALANVLQFFVPGRGDSAQFYNLPGRAVFDPITAVLALVGIGVLVCAFRRPVALFGLLWWPVMMLPSFLATDRAPTLPRVLGTLPGVYFFPAFGLAAALTLLAQRIKRAPDHEHARSPGIVPAALKSSVILVSCAAVAVLVHAALTYHDYFQVWARSPQTYDAFEADMSQAAGWLASNPQPNHVYLSSDIYRHPTFMLLYEHATVTQYFVQQDSRLSWFDARSALPLPPVNQPATYLLPAGSRPTTAEAAALLDLGARRDSAPSAGMPDLLDVVDISKGARQPEPDRSPEAFSDRLALIGASWSGVPPTPLLSLYWQTAGSDTVSWPGYRLEIAGQTADGSEWRQSVSFDDFRPPEWVAGGRFLTWRYLQLPAGTQEPPAWVRMRLVTAEGGVPIAVPGAPDGWHLVTITRPR